MRPDNLKTKIFLDGANPAETKETLNLLGFLDGQTTNPTLISKNPVLAKRLESDKLTIEEALGFYRQTVQKISNLIPNGSVSIEVYADEFTTTEEMLEQSRNMFSWIPNAHIKYPTNKKGLAAAEASVKEGIRVNMTLCFSQQQAAAVYAATKGAKENQVYVSPFIGRLDDLGENGMELIKNIIKIYKTGDRHVSVLTASVRNLSHFLYAIKLGSDIITVPFKILKEWADTGLPMPDDNFTYDPGTLKPIPYQDLNLNQDWDQFDITHPLTDKGIQKFAADWNNLVK